MKKRINSYWYTKEKYKYVFDKEEKQYRINRFTLENGCLYSKAKYPTKIKVEDLPDTYIYGRIYGNWGYINTGGVRDLYYKESIVTKESFKDDFLFVSYNKPINIEAIQEYDYKNQTHDLSLYSHEIFDFIDKILEQDEYKNTVLFENAENIRKQLDDKLKKIEQEKCH